MDQAEVGIVGLNPSPVPPVTLVVGLIVEIFDKLEEK